MRVLLASNHRGILEFDRLGKIQSLGIASIAANFDRSLGEIRIADLISAGWRPKAYFESVVKNYRPDIVGLSCMVYQYSEALELARIAKRIDKNIIVVVGGYGPTIIYDEIAESDDMQYVDYIMRGECDFVFNDLVRAIKGEMDFRDVPNLSYRSNGSVYHNPAAPLLNLDDIKIPDRAARIIKKGFHAVGFRLDAIETSRGCVMNCNFCTIREMYGKSFRKYKIERILDDIRDARKYGAEGLFIVDDNITLDGKRYREICEAITDAGLNNMMYGVQASVKGLKQSPGLIKAMADAGTKVVYLGIENMSEDALNFMHKSGEFRQTDAYEVVKELKERRIGVLAGIISGYPDDTAESIWANYKFCQKIGVDNPIWYLLTPFPKTQIREELIKEGLVTNLHDYSRYTGMDANVRTKTLSSEELKALRESLGFRYFFEAGSLIRMFSENFYFSLRLILNQLLTEPRQFINYTKEFFRISNYRNFSGHAILPREKRVLRGRKKLHLPVSDSQR